MWCSAEVGAIRIVAAGKDRAKVMKELSFSVMIRCGTIERLAYV